MSIWFLTNPERLTTEREAITNLEQEADWLDGIDWQLVGPELTVDANTDHDPEAADLVYASAPDAVMVGADLEPYLILDEARMAQLEQAQAPHSDFTWRMLQFYIDFYESKTGRRVAGLWDPLAAAVLPMSRSA